MEEKINQIRELVREIKSYDDVLYMYEGDKIDLEVKNRNYGIYYKNYNG